MTGYTIRHATARDAAVVAHHRVAMFREMGEVTSDAVAERLRTASAAALEAALADGSYLGWLALDSDQRVIAGAGVHVKPQLPRPSLDGLRIVTAAAPLVVNVYTEPGWRGRGIARALMGAAMAWADAAGCDRLVLHASSAGRPLYESLGFTPTNEMRWAPPVRSTPLRD